MKFVLLNQTAISEVRFHLHEKQLTHNLKFAHVYLSTKTNVFSEGVCMPRNKNWKTMAIAALAPILFSACASAGTTFNWDQARNIKAGMTEEEAIEKIGKPYAVTEQGQRQVWVYSNANASGLANSISLIMKNGRVFEAPRVPYSFKVD
jgi:hypothetical protein